MSGDPLSELLLDAKEVNRELLARTLKNLIGIDTNSGNIVLKSKYGKLSTRHKVLVYLLGKKVSYLLEKADAEEVEPKDITQATGMPPGTVHPKLSELKEDRLISQNDDGKYYIPDHQINNSIDEIGETLKDE
jgi:DNA-binding transcriptional ArsR family regulator